MAPNERSPPRRYREDDERSAKRSYDRRGDYDRRDGEYSRSRNDYRRGDGRRGYGDRDRRDERRDSRRDDGDRHRREYSGRDRDRDRDRGRDTGRDSRHDRRSASPRSRPRSQERRSRSGSRSPEPEVDKAKPNFGASGLLAAETKTVKASDGTKTVLKYHEPPEARKPLIGWRLYVFKGTEQVELLHIQRQSAYLIGRDRAVVDIPVEHPSCSKQHAVIQYRQIRERDEFGETKSSIKPFVIDLESTNGTKVNEETIPTSRYYELKVNDVLKFGDSLREYVLLHEDAS